MDQEVDADGAAFKIQLHRELPGYTLDQLKVLVAQAAAFQQAGARVIPPATTPTNVTDLPQSEIYRPVVATSMSRASPMAVMEVQSQPTWENIGIEHDSEELEAST